VGDAVVGTPQVPVAVDQSAHLGFFYRNRADYIWGTLPFVRDGLAAGVPVLVAVPERGLELLRSELGRDVKNINLIDMTSAGRNPARILPALLLAFADTHPGPVRIIDEPVWPGRSGLEYPACLQHEALINLSFAERPGTILCPYDASRLAPAVLEDTRRTHPYLGSAEHGWYGSVDYDPMQVIAGCHRPLLPPGRLSDLRKEGRSQERQPLERIVLAVVHTVAVGPLVVSRSEDKRSLECLVQLEAVFDELVVTAFASGLDVARVHHEIDVVVTIDLGDKSGEWCFPGRAIRHVTD